MLTRFLAQPAAQIGAEFARLLSSTDGDPQKVTWVSAWMVRQTLLRYKTRLLELDAAGADLRLVLGIDLGGTSREALEELLTWGIDVRLISDRRPRHTFHPKVYLFERPSSAELLIGSANFTDGGLFSNFESAVSLRFDRPEDDAALESMRKELEPFLDPSGDTCLPLSHELVQTLTERGELPSELERAKERIAQGMSRHRRRDADAPESPFGRGGFTSPPALPGGVVKEMAKRASDVRKTPGEPAAGADYSAVQLTPAHFFMTLAAIGQGIPGEQRIPLAARDIARAFWEWPDSYQTVVGGQHEYQEWHPTWRLCDASLPDQDTIEGPVRMYYYAHSSDYRFYSRQLLNLGATSGDVVRITRVSEDPTVYECALARQGTNEYEHWIRSCTEPVRNSDRSWGYA